MSDEESPGTESARRWMTGTRRSVLRVVVASVAAAGVCAGVAAFLGAGSVHPQGGTTRAAARPGDPVGQLGSAPPWPTARRSGGLPLGAVDTRPNGSASGSAPPAGGHGGTLPGAPAASGSGKSAPGTATSGEAASKTSAAGGSGGSGRSTSAHAAKPASGGSSGSGGGTTAGGAAAPAQPSGPVTVTGQISCSSGKPVTGVWVEAAQGHGWSPWKGVGDGADSDYWYKLPTSETYSLHIGCGGTPSSWAVGVETPYVGGTHNSFDCFDVPGRSGYGTCRLR